MSASQFGWNIVMGWDLTVSLASLDGETVTNIHP